MPPRADRARGRRALLRLAPALALAALARPGRAQQEVPLRVGFISILPMTQLFVMEGERWTRGAGLALILKRFSSGPPMVDALAAGDLDVAYIGIGPAMLARARGVDVKVVAANVIEQVALIGRGALVSVFEAAPTPAAAFRRFRETTGRPARIATLPPGAVPDTVAAPLPAGRQRRRRHRHRRRRRGRGAAPAARRRGRRGLDRRADPHHRA
jgi:NitT/TauT family transport system substrate-binding protein